MQAINFFRNESEKIPYAAGQSIFHTEEMGEQMFAVIEGQVELIVGDTVVEIVKEGGFFGEMALIDTRPRSADARAHTDCVLACIDQKRFLFLVQNTPFFAIQVMQVMADRLRRQNQRLADD